MDVALGIICFVAIGLSVAGGLFVWQRAQNHLRHGKAREFERVDLRRQGYGPRETLKPTPVR
jgi:hypothetical protein